MLNVLYDHRFQEKYIFVDYSQVYKSRPLKSRSFTGQYLLFVHFTVISSKLNYQRNPPCVLVPDGRYFFSLSLLVVIVCPEDIVTTMAWGWSSTIFIFVKDDHKARGNRVSSLLLLAWVSCIPAAAEYTANIQTQGPSPTPKNHPLLLHVAQLKDMPCLQPFPLSCYWFIRSWHKRGKSGRWPSHKNDHACARMWL